MYHDRNASTIRLTFVRRSKLRLWRQRLRCPSPRSSTLWRPVQHAGQYGWRFTCVRSTVCVERTRRTRLQQSEQFPVRLCWWSISPIRTAYEPTARLLTNSLTGWNARGLTGCICTSNSAIRTRTGGIRTRAGGIRTRAGLGASNR